MVAKQIELSIDILFKSTPPFKLNFEIKSIVKYLKVNKTYYFSILYFSVKYFKNSFPGFIQYFKITPQ